MVGVPYCLYIFYICDFITPAVKYNRTIHIPIPFIPHIFSELHHMFPVYQPGLLCGSYYN